MLDAIISLFLGCCLPASENMSCTVDYSGTQSSSKTTDETCNTTTKPVEHTCILCFLEDKEKCRHDTIDKIEYGVVEPILYIPVCLAHKKEDEIVNAYCWGDERSEWDEFIAKAVAIVESKK